MSYEPIKCPKCGSRDVPYVRSEPHRAVIAHMIAPGQKCPVYSDAVHACRGCRWEFRPRLDR